MPDDIPRLELRIEERVLSSALDPRLAHLVLLEHEQRAPLPLALASRAGAPGSVDLFVIVHDPGVVVPGFEPITLSGVVLTGHSTLNRAFDIASDPNVVKVELPSRLMPVASDLKDSVHDIECAPEQLRPALREKMGDLTGKGIIVGIIDDCCDFAHPNFYLETNGTKQTRIISIWDQSASASSDAPAKYGFGREIKASAINVALAADDPYATLKYSPRASDHGTHVMDVACGSGAVSPGGVAPHADIIFVDIDASDVPLGGGSLGNSARLIQAIDYIFQTAQGLGKPAVVNLSVNSDGGPHDGTRAFDLAVEEYLKAPGRAIVVAAGDSYNDALHMSGVVGEEGFAISWALTSVSVGGEQFEIWYSGADALSVSIEAPTGIRLESVPPGKIGTITWGSRTVGRVTNTMGDPVNHDNQIMLVAEPGFPLGIWQIVLRRTGTANVPFNAWAERFGEPSAKFASSVDQRITLGSLSCGRSPLVVGAYNQNLRQRGLSTFTPMGMTRDGRKKPDVVAPGSLLKCAKATKKGETEGVQGTSISAPHASGLIALLFEADHTLDMSKVQAVVTGSALRLPGAASWDARAGWGAVDGVAAVRKLLGT